MNLKWQIEYSEDEAKKDYVSAINDNNVELAKMDRWPNSALLFTKPAEITLEDAYIYLNNRLEK